MASTRSNGGTVTDVKLLRAVVDLSRPSTVFLNQIWCGINVATGKISGFNHFSSSQFAAQFHFLHLKHSCWAEIFSGWIRILNPNAAVCAANRGRG
jgi:hypothetical protein